MKIRRTKLKINTGDKTAKQVNARVSSDRNGMLPVAEGVRC
jgi:hypothetical protein